MNYQKIRQNPKQFLSITSLDTAKFDELLPFFRQEWEKFIHHFTLEGMPRVRPYVADKNEFLPDIEQKLFFILAYQKNATLQEFFAASFDTDQSVCNKWVHLLSPILGKALAHYCPKRDIEEVDFSQEDTYLIDATERAVQRDSYRQEDFYSGKKKKHTVKNVVICSVLGVLLYLSPTVPGKIHDKKMTDNYKFTTDNINFYADLAFIGWKPSESIHIILPHKKPKNTKTKKKQLYKQDIDFNKQHSKIRVKVENLLAHVKTMRILKDTIRNYKEGFKDLVMLTAAALYNFKNNYKIS